MQYIYLLLGSNLGDRENNLACAREKINKVVGAIEKTSSLYQTASWGITDQPDFLNQVLLLNTELEPMQVLFKIFEIEKDLGRKRNKRWGSRTIDIDILFYGNMIVRQKNLTIPHPQLHNRAFTLIPLSEIAPDLIHPVLNKPIFELCENLIDKLCVKRIST